MDYKKKIISETEIKSRLKNGRIPFMPAILKFENSGSNLSSKQLDGIISVLWSDKKAIFGVEIKSFSTPKSFAEALSFLVQYDMPANMGKMMVVPYLNEDRLSDLQKAGISGIDLCGNGIIISKNFSVYQSGKPNLFPQSAPIKNVYRKNSSLVGRVFLSQPSFPSVGSIKNQINDLDVFCSKWSKSSIQLSTVSKVLAVMEEDLLVSRQNGRIKLIQPDMLLNKLVQNYDPPKEGQKISLKVDVDRNSLMSLLREVSSNSQVPFVVTGLSSVSQYAIMQRGVELTIYSPNPEIFLTKLPGKETDRFPNLTILENIEPATYFDAREKEGIYWASPVQTYLELIKGDKRDQETAEQVKNLIIGKLKEE
jgi:hypothetical protein